MSLNDAELIDRLETGHTAQKEEIGRLVELANKWKERALKAEAPAELHFKLEEDGSLSGVMYKRTGEGAEIKEYIGRPAQFEWVEFQGEIEKPTFHFSPLNVHALKNLLSDSEAASNGYRTK